MQQSNALVGSMSTYPKKQTKVSTTGKILNSLSLNQLINMNAVEENALKFTLLRSRKQKRAMRETLNKKRGFMLLRSIENRKINKEAFDAVNEIYENLFEKLSLLRLEHFQKMTNYYNNKNNENSNYNSSYFLSHLPVRYSNSIYNYKSRLRYALMVLISIELLTGFLHQI
jgi:hypothetical protein